MKKVLHKGGNVKKMLSRILFSASTFTLLTNFVFASGDISSIVNDMNNSADPVYVTIREITGWLSGIGAIVAVLKLAHIGIMFMMSGTSASAKKDAKSSLMPWAVGLLVCMLFGVVGPWVIGLLMDGNTGGVFDI